MEALFYLNTARVSLGDIATLAAEQGLHTNWVYVGPADNASLILRIQPADGDRWHNWYWQLVPESEWHGNFEAEGFEIIAAYGPASVFQIDEHSISWPRLRLLLASVLERFGGWVGCDSDDGFDPIFTRDNIHLVDDPLYAVALAHVRRQAAQDDPP